MKAIWLIVCLLVVGIAAGNGQGNKERQSEKRVNKRKAESNLGNGQIKEKTVQNVKQSNKRKLRKKNKKKKLSAKDKKQRGKARNSKQRGKFRKERKKTKGKKKNRKGKNAKKNKKNKKKQSRKNKHRKGARITCSADTLNNTCLENAQLALQYEKNQVTNFLKQAARLRSHKNIKEKKLGKKGEFEEAADHLIDAIGGNFSSPKCGDPADNSTEALKIKEEELRYILTNYTKLMNCSTAIKEACTLPNETFNATIEAEMSQCNKTKWKFILDSRACYQLQLQTKPAASASALCGCWAQAAADVEAIKKLNCNTKKRQNEITKRKNECKKVFASCKKMEDQSVHLIYHCLHDHSMDLLNQTAKSIHAGIIKDVARNLEREESMMKFSYDLD